MERHVVLQHTRDVKLLKMKIFARFDFSGSPGRGSSPPRDRRAAHEQEKVPREMEEDRRHRSDDEEEEWEYEEDMGEEKDKILARQGERYTPL